MIDVIIAKRGPKTSTRLPINSSITCINSLINGSIYCNNFLIASEIRFIAFLKDSNSCTTLRISLIKIAQTDSPF